MKMNRRRPLKWNGAGLSPFISLAVPSMAIRFLNMKSFLPLAVFFTGLSLGMTWVAAADTTVPGENREKRMISFLPEDQQTEVLDAYKKAITDNADLLKEKEDFRANHPDFATATPADKQAFMQKVRAHQEKLRTAMLKEDPKLDPILDKIEKHRKEMRGQP